jgi:hypothetical protein
MPDRIKMTRLEELDLKAKSLLEAWNKDTFGQRQQDTAGYYESGDAYQFTNSYYRRNLDSSADNYKVGQEMQGTATHVNHSNPHLVDNQNPRLGRTIGSVLYNSQHGRQWHSGPIPPDRVSDYNPNKPFHKFGDKNHKRQNATQDRQEIFKAAEGGFDAFFAKVDEVSARNEKQVGPKTLEERWLDTELKGGPASEAKGGGSANRYPGRTGGVEHRGEQSAGLSVKFGDVNAFVPDNPGNRDLFEGFKKAYQTGKKVNFDDGKGGGESLSMLDIFFRLSDTARMTKYGAGTIRELYDTFFADGNAPTIQATKILRRNQLSQEDMNAQYDEGREYKFTDSYYRYKVGYYTNLEIGDSDDPVTRSNHQSFTLSRPDENTIELKKDIQRATVRNPDGDQWPNRSTNGKAIFNRNNQYNKDFTRSNTYVYRGRIFQDDNVDIEVTPLGWPDVTGISPNTKSFGNNRRARNLEELWFSLANLKADGPSTDQVQRSGQSIRLSSFFSSDRISNLDYKVRFLGALNGSFANVPDSRDVDSQGAAGFNVGQVQPYNKRTGEYQFGDGREMDMYDFGRLRRILQKINSYEQDLMEIKPGGNRINIVFNIRVNLEKLLQQNLLMPTDLYPAQGNPYTGYRTTDLATAIEEGTSSTLDDDTFTKLYLENRSALHAKDRGNHARTPPGTIAGVPVADLQGPVTPQSYDGPGKYKTGNANDDNTVFKFRDEDGPQGRNNTITQDRGFIDNIAGQVHGNRQGIAGLMPAVENDGANSTGGQNEFQNQTTFLKTRSRANEQFFPFMFETINKRGSARNGTEYKQYAYFQATLQSLNESYAPAWSSKHFFGRTEQIHTYTMTERTIDLSFVIFATEIRRLQNLYERVSWLAQQTYPSYDTSNRLKSGPLIKMTVGDMFSGLNGFIRSLSFDWNYLGPGGKWEITQGLRIPMACTVTMNFTVMHDDMPDRNYNLYPGPLRGGKGMIGERGESQSHPEGGPLISTADRAKRSDDAATAEARRQGASGEGFSLSFDEQLEKINRAALEAVQGNNGVTQQYIDWVNQNTSIGKLKSDKTQYTNAAGDIDLVFD